MIFVWVSLYNHPSYDDMQAMELNTANTWQEWYAQSTKVISYERIAKVRNIHKPFLNTILAQKASTAIEVGIGTGTLGHSLVQLAEERESELEVVELDYCLPFLQNARNFNGEYKIIYINADTFALPFASTNKAERVIFHQGLLEHFNDDELSTMLSEQLRVSSTVIATVPSHEYVFKEGLRGDERLMSIEDWIRIISKNFNTTGFYYGMLPGERYHICLIIT